MDISNGVTLFLTLQVQTSPLEGIQLQVRFCEKFKWRRDVLHNIFCNIETDLCFLFFFFQSGTALHAGLGAAALLAMLVLVIYFRKCRNRPKAQAPVHLSNSDFVKGHKAVVRKQQRPAGGLIVPVKWSNSLLTVFFFCMCLFINASHGNNTIVFNSCCLKNGFSSSQQVLFTIGAWSEASNVPIMCLVTGPSSYVWAKYIIIIHFINYIIHFSDKAATVAASKSLFIQKLT